MANNYSPSSNDTESLRQTQRKNFVTILLPPQSEGAWQATRTMQEGHGDSMFQDMGTDQAG
jgi:hypothetical protein